MPLPELHQTTNTWVGLADFLARLAAPDPTAAAEGLCWGGGTPTATYPAFLALVVDDTGQLWPCGSAAAVEIEFVDATGTCGLYLVPFDDQELPSSEPGRIGAFTLVAQLATTSAPADALKLGEGSVSDSAFTSFSEAAGLRRDTLAIGSGHDGDITLLARNGDANPPGLRYQASSNQWQVSNDGTTWGALGGAVSSVFGRTGAVTAQSGDYTAGQVGAVPASEKGAANGVASLGADTKVPDAQLPTDLVRTSGDQTIGGVKTFSSRPQYSSYGLRSEGPTLVARLTSDVSVSTGSTVNLAWNEVSVNNDTFSTAARSSGPFAWTGSGDADAYKLTLASGSGGLYLVNLMVGWNETTSLSGLRYAGLYLGASTPLARRFMPASFLLVHEITQLVYLSASQFLRVEVWQDSGASKSVQSTSYYTLFTATRVQ